MNHTALLACRDAIFSALTAEMNNRRDNPGLRWIHSERMAVLNAANDWAVKHNGHTVSLDDVIRVESSASGHVDYASKFALHVAELAVYGTIQRQL